ncbi:hypothetical protein T484DRAFT_3213394 [Baffinella frigidus]|nr:hypothetical protein T484DRAFT_3213394 [Cryptophyta sp. CCMP2293]
MVRKASGTGDWAGVLKWESRLGEILETVSGELHPEMLDAFAVAHFKEKHFEKSAIFYEKSLPILGKMERYRDQGSNMCQIGQCFSNINDTPRAVPWFNKARALGAQHGFFSVECGACLGLGRVEKMEGRMPGAEELMQHAFSVLGFVEVEGEREQLECSVTRDLAELLLETERYEEAGPLIQRLFELAEADEDKEAGFYRKVGALGFAVRFHSRRRDVQQASKEMRALEGLLKRFPGAGCEDILQRARTCIRELASG